MRRDHADGLPLRALDTKTPHVDVVAAKYDY